MRLYKKMIFINENVKKEKELAIGKDWWILFFGPIVLFYRKQFYLSFVSIITLFIANFYFFLKANELRVKKYKKNGWIEIDDVN